MSLVLHLQVYVQWITGCSLQKKARVVVSTRLPPLARVPEAGQAPSAPPHVFFRNDRFTARGAED
jgi:hypothetical protein